MILPFNTPVLTLNVENFKRKHHYFSNISGLSVKSPDVLIYMYTYITVIISLVSFSSACHAKKGLWFIADENDRHAFYKCLRGYGYPLRFLCANGNCVPKGYTMSRFRPCTDLCDPEVEVGGSGEGGEGGEGESSGCGGEEIGSGESGTGSGEGGSGETVGSGEEGSGETIGSGEEGSGEIIGSGETIGSGEEGSGETVGSGEEGSGELIGSGEVGSGETIGSGEEGSGEIISSGEGGTGETIGSGDSGSGSEAGSGETERTGSGSGSGIDEEPSPRDEIFGDFLQT